MVNELAWDGQYSSEEFEQKYTYNKKDLGAAWSKEHTTFRVWAPLASACSVVGYKEGDKESKEQLFEVPMEPSEQGTWAAEVMGDLHGVYYTYKATIRDEQVEACDPYAKAVGVNGDRAMVIDLARSNPEGWGEDQNPNKELAINDAIIYELHVRDFSIDEHSGMQHKGEFLAFTEQGTTNEYGQSTGVDYLKDLGITHVHLLPVYDYGSVDERDRDSAFNWGYDPKNYNVPEGTYATNPYDGEVRIREMKQMVKSLHDNGISVIMDVVYNHVYDAGSFCFNQLVPGYFTRISKDGVYSNGSYCGNDTASERSMVHNYIVQSILYWMEEFHIDGFRFDLVGLIDIDTINELVREVKAIRPDVIFYGEGWDMPTVVTKNDCKMAIQMNSQLTPDFAYFNDSIRDLMKGKYSDVTEAGYVNGAKGKVDELKGNLMGMPYWAPSPAQVVQYSSCHDDLGIYDRLQIASKGADKETLAAYNRLAAAIVFLSEGIPFIHAGEEFLRTKVNEEGKIISNSYNSPDYVNKIRWNQLHDEVCAETRAYYKGLIAFRKAHSALRLRTAEEVRKAFYFMPALEGEAIAYQIDAREIESEQADQILVILNPEMTSTTITLPQGKWDVFVEGKQAGTNAIATVEGTVEVPPISTMVLVQ